MKSTNVRMQGQSHRAKAKISFDVVLLFSDLFCLIFDLFHFHFRLDLVWVDPYVSIKIWPHTAFIVFPTIISQMALSTLISAGDFRRETLNMQILTALWGFDKKDGLGTFIALFHRIQLVHWLHIWKYIQQFIFLFASKSCECGSKENVQCQCFEFI